MSNILDEARAFVAAHVSASDAQLDAMTLYAAATHGIRHCVTFGRLLFTSQEAESGKTLAMTVTAHLSSRPMDTSGSIDALNSAIAAASNEPEKPVPTPFRDEISDVFGKSGINGGSNPIAEYLRKGYKKGATRQRSVNRMPEEYSIFTPFIMSGLRTAVPRDIRTRCIIIAMESGTPRKYYSVREGEPDAHALASSLSKHVQAHAQEIARFRGRGLHPKLSNRKLEVWEPLLAVAYAVGGQRWLNRAVIAFTELALDESETVPLTPDQELIRDLATVAAASSTGFIGGMELADELQRLDNPRYTGRSHAALCCLIRDVLPMDSEQRRVGTDRVRGYARTALIDVWEASKPADDTEDIDVPEEENPFDVTDVTDSDSDDVFENTALASAVTGVTGVTGQIAESSQPGEATT
jgi:Protein of unknown function (DUF3631)